MNDYSIRYNLVGRGFKNSMNNIYNIMLLLNLNRIVLKLKVYFILNYNYFY